MRKLSLALTLVLVTTVLFAGICPAAASQPEGGVAQNQVEFQANLERSLMVRQAVTIMERHMVVTDAGTISLDEAALSRDIDAGAAEGVEPAIFAQLTEALAQTNARIRAGEIVASDVFPSSASDLTSAVRSALQSCAGWTGVDDSWWGHTVYLNQCDTDQLIGLLQQGVGGAALCAAFVAPARVGCGIVVAIGEVGVGVLSAVHARGGYQGLYFVFIGTPLDAPIGVAAPIYFWHQ